MSGSHKIWDSNSSVYTVFSKGVSVNGCLGAVLGVSIIVKVKDR